MFGEFVEARVGEAGRKRWAIAASVMAQAAVLTTLVLMPLLYTEALPNVLERVKRLMVPAMPLVEAPKPPEAPVQRVRQSQRLFDGGVIHEPRFIPPTVAIFEEPPLPPELLAITAGPSFLGTDLLGPVTTSRSEPEPPPVVPAPVQRIHQTEIQPAMILSQPQPPYPRLALIARIQGDVVLHAIIDREGRVAELEVLSGHPVLVKAALDTVQLWRYRPTLLNGEPVEVETTIKVSFVLGDRR
jgi:protein TonB